MGADPVITTPFLSTYIYQVGVSASRGEWRVNVYPLRSSFTKGRTRVKKLTSEQSKHRLKYSIYIGMYVRR
jgi:hypothetical protein